MSVNLIGVTAQGGVPLFARHAEQQSSQSESQSDNTGIEFSTLAALNGVNLFSRLNDCELLYSATKCSQIRWKVYKGCIVLIIVCSDISDVSDHNLHNFLDIVFDSLIIICGLNEITSLNIERLKRCVRLSYQLIDYLLNCFVSNWLSKIALITNTIQYLHTNQSDLTALVESSAQCASSSFSALFFNKKLICATKQWWTRLSCSRDALIISFLVNSLTETDLLLTKEMTIYLPENCPTSLTRLIVSKLPNGAVLCLLCGEIPSLETIEKDIISPLIDSNINRDKFSKFLQNEVRIEFGVNENIIGFIVVRNDIKIFNTYGRIENNYLKYMTHCIDQQNDNNEYYITRENVRFYHISNGFFEIYVILPLNIGLPESRNIVIKTLNLVKDKHIWPLLK